MIVRAIPHNSKCRYGERGAADAKPKAQIILDAAKVSAASGGNSEPKQGQRSQSARGFCPRSTMRLPQPDIIEHFGNADAVPQPPERCLSRQAGIVRCCLNFVLVPPGGELDAMRPEGWFLIACIKNHGINPAQYCRLKCIKAAKREPSHGYYDEVPILLFLFRIFRRGLFAKRPENPP